MMALRLSGISYSYGDGAPALDGVDMEIACGECVAVLGPNGAGKSTLLKIMAGLLDPGSGTLEIKGEKLTRKNADSLRKSIGILFQDPDDQIFMPRVWDDVAFGPLNRGLKGQELDIRVRDALKITGLEDFAERVPHHLSYGEKKRVAIAGVLAMKPEILLLDEPTANLDPVGRKELLALLKGLGCTIIMATHDMEAAAAMADRVYLLDGKVLASGRKRDILTDGKLLESAGLEMTAIARFFSELKMKGKYAGEIPLTVEEAGGKEEER